MSTSFPSPEYVTYDVSADTLSGVADAIADMPEAGMCEWFPTWSVDDDDAGVVTSATVEVATRITLPNWVEESSASGEEQTEWRRFLTALTDHEHGHLEIVYRELADVDQTMTGGSEADARQAFDDAITRLQQESDDYDSSTDHGRNDGTTIDA